MFIMDLVDTRIKSYKLALLMCHNRFLTKNKEKIGMKRKAHGSAKPNPKKSFTQNV